MWFNFLWADELGLLRMSQARMEVAQTLLAVVTALLCDALEESFLLSGSNLGCSRRPSN